MTTCWVPDLPNIKGIYGHLLRPILIFANGVLYICMIQQIHNKYVSSNLWRPAMFFTLKITTILKSSGWGLEKSELPWEQNFYSLRCVSHRTISPPSSALQIGQDSSMYI